VKAVCIHEFGGIDQVRVEDVPDPEPRPGYVRIRVSAAAFNHVDVDIRDGISRFDVALPHILGLELVGTIDQLGEGVDPDWKVGERVMPYLLGFTDYFIGVGGPGGFAEYVVAPAQQLVRVPDELGDEDAAALQVAFGTAWHMLFTRGRLSIGESVLITSVSAGIASAAVQLAKLGGAYVIGSSSSQAKLERAKALGMDAGIDYTTEDVPARVRELTGGKGVDLVFEHVGGRMFQDGLDSLAWDGRLVTCGGHGGEVVPLDIIPFFRSQHQVIGSFVYSREELEKVLALGARGMIKPLIAKTFPLEEAREAMALLESREFFGKILLLP
jgi:NADPH:quinone reductase-like Zn-dependent oxidoreductase